MDIIIDHDIIERVEKGNILDEKGEYEKALEIYMDEWENFPRDKYNDDLSLWIASCIFGSYFSLEKYNEAKHWALECLKMKLPDYAIEEFMRAGEVYFELNEFDEAYSYFKIAYDRGKKRSFQSHDKKYWLFFKQRTDSLQKI